MQNVYEGLFLLKYYGNFTMLEGMTLPVRLRIWMIERLSKQKETEAEKANPKGK